MSWWRVYSHARIHAHVVSQDSSDVSIFNQSTLLLGATKISFRLLKFWIIQVCFCRTSWFPCSLVSVHGQEIIWCCNACICCTDHWQFCFCSGWRLYDIITQLLTDASKPSHWLRCCQTSSGLSRTSLSALDWLDIQVRIDMRGHILFKNRIKSQETREMIHNHKTLGTFKIVEKCVCQLEDLGHSCPWVFQRMRNEFKFCAYS